jgi:hypothetical protein
MDSMPIADALFALKAMLESRYTNYNSTDLKAMLESRYTNYNSTDTTLL